MYIQKLEDGSVLLTAPVMVPGVPDCDYNRGEPALTRNQVEFFAKSHEKYQFIDDEHKLTRGGQRIGDPMESVLLEADKSYELFDGTTETYPAGTWMLTSHLTEKESVQKALNGEYTGYSPTVRSRNVADSFLEEYNSALKSQVEEDIALKSFSSSGLIRDVPDPVVLSVSLTKKPCQTHSKFCKLKNKNGENMADNKDSKTLAKVREILGMSANDDVEALKSQVDSFDEKLDEIKNENAEALKSMKEDLKSDFKDMLKEAFADKKQKTDGDPEEDNPDDKGGQSGDEGSEGGSSGEKPEDPEDDDKKSKGKGGSKQGKNHNGQQQANKSQEVDTYTFLGRNPDGTSKRN